MSDKEQISKLYIKMYEKIINILKKLCFGGMFFCISKIDKAQNSN
jgi:hypothetical protein